MNEILVSDATDERIIFIMLLFLCWYSFVMAGMNDRCSPILYSFNYNIRNSMFQWVNIKTVVRWQIFAFI